MTIADVEQVQCDEHDRIRIAIATASPQDREGLMNVVDVYRDSEFTVVPSLMGAGFEQLKGPKARAMEVMLTEQCLDSIWIVEALARVVLGVAKGLRSLYRLGILHCDVSPGNILVSQSGEGVLIDYDVAIFMDTPSSGRTGRFARGTCPFQARVMATVYLKKRILHQSWHDIESLLYVILFIVIGQPQGPRAGTHEVESKEEQHERSRKLQSAIANTKWELITNPKALTKLLSPCQDFWVRVGELADILVQHCDPKRPSIFPHENKGLGGVPPRWESGESSHDHLISDLECFIESLA